MGSCYRSLSNRRCWLQYCAEIRELSKDYPYLKPIGHKGKIPDPWGDYIRNDVFDCCWKRHRKTQYRVKQPALTKVAHPKVVYDTHWVRLGPTWYWYKKAPFRKGRGGWTQFRVRESYRRHRVDE
jgi:hypothetical protein